MKLTRDQSQKLLHERGIWITNACDKCGQLLGAVRWTRRNEEGEWCSPECRDGVKVELKPSAVATRQTVEGKRIASRAAGRPKKHANNAEKQRSYRSTLKNGLALRNTPSQSIENAQLAAAKNGCHVVGLVPETQALETLPTQESAR
jgi:hypothetical protein